jgi:hypothetical protein
MTSAHCWVLAAFLVSWYYVQSKGLIEKGISPTQSLYIHTEHKQNKRTQISLPRVQFQPTILVFERAKIFHALGRSATVIGLQNQ